MTMNEPALLEELSHHLRKQQFVNMATSTPDGKPHVSPKLYFKNEGSVIYLIEQMKDSAMKNVRANPFVAVSTFDIKEVTGYFVYGRAEITDQGPENKSLLEEWKSKQTKVVADQVVEDVRGEKNIKSIKLAFLPPIAFYKISIDSIEKLDANVFA
jgi:general stress protein 26